MLHPRQEGVKSLALLPTNQVLLKAMLIAMTYEPLNLSDSHQYTFISNSHKSNTSVACGSLPSGDSGNLAPFGISWPFNIQMGFRRSP